MTTKLDGIEQDVRTLKQRLDEHVGDIGSDVHGVATAGLPGFMPSEFYEPVHDLVIDRQGITSGDVFALEPGFYYGSNLTNIPPSADATAGALIDVLPYSGAGSGRKFIRYTIASANTTWEKIIHVPGGFNKEWAQIAKTVVLWSGTLTDTMVEQTLVESVSHFSYLQVNFGTTSANENSAVFRREYGGPGINLNASNISDNNQTLTTIEAKLVVDTGTTFRLSTNRSFTQSVASSAISASDAKIVVNSVWGLY